MSFSKALKPSVEALDEFTKAKVLWSSRCRELQRLRVLAEHPAATDQQEAAYSRARRAHREYYKEYEAALAALRLSIKPSTVLQNIPSAAPVERGISMPQLADMYQQDKIMDEIKSGQYDELIEQLTGKTREQIENPSVKDQFLGFKKTKKEDDPTLGDFEPL